MHCKKIFPLILLVGSIITQNPVNNITKVIIPAAGLGTRFLPWTKSVPKELLPIMNKPAIQYCIEECLDSGFSTFSIITSKGKEALTDYLDSHQALAHFLQDKNKSNLTACIDMIVKRGQFTFIRQSEQLGLGHAVLQAKHTIGNEYFGVLLPDNISTNKEPVLGYLAQIAKKYNASVIAVSEVPWERVSAYGVISYSRELEDGIYDINHLVEKPSQEDAPSNLCVTGRYILSPKIFDSLEKLVEKNIRTKYEYQLTDAIEDMLQQGERVIAVKIDGIMHDTGNPVGWFKAVVSIALENPKYHDDIYAFLQRLVLTRRAER